MPDSDYTDFDPRDRKQYYFTVTPLRRYATLLVKTLLKSVMTLHVSGVENLPARGPVVLAANHLAEFDVFPIQFAIPRPIFFMGKAELFRHPLMDVILRHLGGFPVARGARDQWALRHAARILEHCEVLGIFPEGTRSRGRGLLPARTGAARLAIQASCPVVLLALDGTQRMFAAAPRRTRVTVTLSRPVLPWFGESPLDFSDRLMFKLAEMLPAELRGVYAEHPAGFD